MESAYPGQIYIQRTQQGFSDGAVDYEVRVYADETTVAPRLSAFTEIVLVVSDESGVQLVSAQIEFSEPVSISPNKNKFRSFSFSIRKGLEKTTVINVGRYNGARMLFTRYRLPLKSIDHPKAH